MGQADGNDSKARIEILKKRELNFKRMLKPMRRFVLLQKIAGLNQFPAQVGIDFTAPQWGIPGISRIDGSSVTSPMMVGPNDYNGLRDMNTAENGTGNRAGIDVAGMRGNNAKSMSCVPFRDKGRDCIAQGLFITGVELSSDGRFTHHGRSPQVFRTRLCKQSANR
jgi:hypothetical protein